MAVSSAAAASQTLRLKVIGVGRSDAGSKWLAFSPSIG